MMARKQSADFDRRKDNIVAKAATLFANRGFLGTSVADLAAACETSKALVYHYFGSKEDVLYAVMSTHLDALLDMAETLSADIELDAAARLQALTRGFMALYAGAADFQKVLLNELDNLPPERASDIVHRQRQIIEIARTDIEAVGQRFGPDRTFPLTMIYFGMINWAHTWYAPDGPIKPDELADLATSVLLDGFRER
jgi:AcrR family transcriptional regulator